MSNNQPTPTADEMRVLIEEMGARKVDAPYLYSEIVTGRPDEEFFQLDGIAIGTLEWFIHNAPDSFLLACLRFMESDEARKAEIAVKHCNWASFAGMKPETIIKKIGPMGIFSKTFTDPFESRIVRAACAVAAEIRRAKEASK